MELLINIKEKRYYRDIIFKNCSFVFNSNLIKLEGENGAGKSTLFKMLAAKTEFKGKVYIDKVLIKNANLSRNFVLVDQEIALIEEKSVYYNIKSVEDKNADESIIEEFGFSDKLNKKVSTLSGGWKKKLMILLAFISNPKILLLDEYTNYLDKEFVSKVNDYILKFSKEHMVIYIDHNFNIGGEVVDITKINSIKNIEKVEYKKREKFRFSKKYFKTQFSPFKLFSLIFIIFFEALLCANASLNNMTDVYTQKDLYCDYLLDNHLNYIRLSSTLDCETTYDPFFGYNFDYDDVEYITYTDDLELPLASELSTPDDVDVDVECYVSNVHKKMLGTSIKYNNQVYFVKGVLDINTDNYSNDYLDSLFIEGSAPDDTSYFDFECIYATDEEIKEEKDFVIANKNLSFNISNMIDNFDTYSTFIYIASYILFFSFIISSFITIRKEEKKRCYLLTHYNKSNRELRLVRFVSYLIKFIGIAIVGLIIGYYIYIGIVYKFYSFTPSMKTFSYNYAILLGVVYFVLITIFDLKFIRNMYDNDMIED